MSRSTPDTSSSVPVGAKPGDLALQPCQFKTGAGTFAADCGTLIVPENRAKSDSRLIALPIIRVRATGNVPAEPIFWLEGGPGMSNVKFKPPNWLLANHDMVAVGYRGVDGSIVLDCPEVSKASLGVGGDLLSKESRANFGSALKQCARRLQAEGVDLDGYTIPEVVADLEIARAGLGYEQVNLLSQSYGTRVAQIYAYLHPNHIRRSVMIGVNPPGHFVYEPDMIDAQLNYYSGLCAQNPKCRARTPDLAETMRRVTHNMPKRWLLVPIDPGKVKMVTFAQLFNRGTAAMVFDAYLAAEAGDPSGLALMSLASDFVFPSLVTWGEFFAKGSTADFDVSRNYAAAMNPPDSILGSPLNYLIFDGLAENWPISLIPGELRQVHPSDVETLLVSGSVDFSTPPEFATKELLPHLTHGKQVIVKEVGHVDDLWNLQPAATERLLTSFYSTGVADDSLYTYDPMNFDVSIGFPGLSKLVLGVALLLGIVIVAVVWSIVRRSLRKQTT